MNHTLVGFLGAVLGAIARAQVHESVAWVKQFNLFSDNFQEIELSFGDINLTEQEEFISLKALALKEEKKLKSVSDGGFRG